MNINDIKALLEQSEWYQPNDDDSSIYLAKDDIFLKFKVEKEEDGDFNVGNLPPNIQSFYRILDQDIKISEVSLNKVHFYYQKQVIRAFDIYKFGSSHNNEKIYFAKPTNQSTHVNIIDDIFYKVIIKKLNTEFSLGKIIFANGNFE
ncbi:MULTISPECIES: hypothetical protein [Acinetobacter]|uniref:Uncharacterized protein n=1 Tax=Acinetobacter brisouii CIP 110357 TaxID=1341683 RepID=V2UPA5_9GAMM|nr:MULTISPECIES: hypothetical protein [Acinetobacter]ENV48325.1 hypothetical protein F954_01393 [Acinetobacter brisouii ANC 4119]ESK51777.1 hypothetical protein P255_01206 [Acinetobacter brisouii CIP 110357]TCB11047.1 hypothetical protein E0H78_08495 [Acinetobacter sp. ANC 4641]